MTDFNTNDLNRLREAADEIKQFGEFLKDRLITRLIILGKPVPRRNTLSVPQPLVTVFDPKDADRGDQFHVRQCLGGDRFGVDYTEHYLPVDYALGGEDADNALRKQVEEAKRLESLLSH